MPVTYALDREKELVVTVCSGRLVLHEVLEHFEELRADPRLPESLDVLLDLSAVTSLPHSDQLREVASAVDRLRSIVRWGRCAVVATRDALFGMSRVFEALTEQHFKQVMVFRERGDAETWLAQRP